MEIQEGFLHVDLACRLLVLRGQPVVSTDHADAKDEANVSEDGSELHGRAQDTTATKSVDHTGQGCTFVTFRLEDPVVDHDS